MDIKERAVAYLHSDQGVHIVVRCEGCSREYIVAMTDKQFANYSLWLRDEKSFYIQQALPDMSESDRELLLSATCNECWELLLDQKEEDYEEYDE